MAEHVVNSAAQEVFSYNAAALTAITTVRADLFIDLEENRGPTATELSTGVFLRNQNRAPVASFTASASPSEIILNGSASSDPEGDPLTYEWFVGGSPRARASSSSTRAPAPARPTRSRSR